MSLLLATKCRSAAFIARKTLASNAGSISSFGGSRGMSTVDQKDNILPVSPNWPFCRTFYVQTIPEFQHGEPRDRCMYDPS